MTVNDPGQKGKAPAMIYHTHTDLQDGYEDRRYSLSDLDATVRSAVRTLRPRADEFDTIVAQGMSGVVVAAPLALLLRKPLSIVRKPSEDSHQQTWYAGSLAQVIGRSDLAGSRALFVDDCVDTGSTLWRVEHEVKASGGEITAVYLYEIDTYDERSRV